MAQEPDRSIEHDELRKRFMDEEVYKQQRFLAELEAPRISEYRIPIQIKDELVKLRFRPWNHGELMVITRMPFFQKIRNKEVLTSEENEKFTAIEEQMLDMIALDNNQWLQLSKNHPEIIGSVWVIMMGMSGVKDDFNSKLERFMSSDYGFIYGKIWFEMMGKTPSEVSKISETDYQAVSMWIVKWLERMGEKK